MAIVILPRSLVALFPGADRRQDLEAATVAELIDRLDERIPGIRNRLVDAGPTLREHLNVFVAGERASLDSPIPPGATVHVIPAISGGSGTAARLKL
jgi:molybdopterin converting factor small subunit